MTSFAATQKFLTKNNVLLIGGILEIDKEG